MADKMTVIAGKKKGKYTHVPLETIVGKTVEAVAETAVDSAYGAEPCTMLFFSDGTKHGFVHPADSWE